VKRVEIERRRQRFIEEYPLDANATQAAIRAGYSSRTANRQGSRLLGNREILAAIQARMAKRSERLEISGDQVLVAVAEVAGSDPRQLFDETGKLRPMKDWPDGLARAVEAIEFDGDGKLKRVRLAPKTPALALLMRHLGLIKEVVLPQQVNVLLALLDPGMLTKLSDDELALIKQATTIAKRVVGGSEARR